MTLLETIARAKRTFVDQRRSFRRATNCSAWIELGDHAPPRTCTIVDVSTGGARIVVNSPDDLPEAFSLIFTISGGRITRRVRIVWRAGGEIGVRYL